jgi:pyruvate dehydrogenase E1 component alpha subunit
MRDINLDKSIFIDFYKKMFSIRLFEETVLEQFSKNQIPGTVHLYSGQEAVAVGVCSALKMDDYIVSTHRGHGHSIAKGCSMKLMMAELFGKRTGYCKGKGGSMHVCDFKKGMLGAMGVVGSGIPIAGGAALSSKLLSNGRIAVSFFGDGAVNLGAFHESLNLAAVWCLPVVFVCENNLYAMSTHASRIMLLQDIADRASAYGMPGIISDGMDVIDVYEKAKHVVENARKGEGPTLLECKTYKWRGHSRLDPATYRPKNELEEWKKRDPLEIFKKNEFLSSNEIKEIENEVKSEIDEAVNFASDSSWPNSEEALDDVFA